MSPEGPWPNGGPKNLHVTDGAPTRAAGEEIEEVYFWALLAQVRQPWCDESAPAAGRMAAFGWAHGALDLLAWACGEIPEGPLSGQCVTGRPTFYQVSRDASRAMAGVESARHEVGLLKAARLEAIMETFLWLAG